MSIGHRITVRRLVDWGTPVPLSSEALAYLQRTAAAQFVPEVDALLRHGRALHDAAVAHALHLAAHQYAHTPPGTSRMTFTISTGGRAADIYPRLESQAEQALAAATTDREREQITSAVERVKRLVEGVAPGALVSVSIQGHARGEGNDASLYESSSISVTSADTARESAARSKAVAEHEDRATDISPSARKILGSAAPRSAADLELPEPGDGPDPHHMNATDIARLNEATAVRQQPTDPTKDATQDGG